MVSIYLSKYSYQWGQNNLNDRKSRWIFFFLHIFIDDCRLEHLFNNCHQRVFLRNPAFGIWIRAFQNWLDAAVLNLRDFGNVTIYKKNKNIKNLKPIIHSFENKLLPIKNLASTETILLYVCMQNIHK